MIAAGLAYTGIQLQWGHAFVSVETFSPAIAEALAKTGFNGATLL